jgi:hypothetical protein
MKGSTRLLLVVVALALLTGVWTGSATAVSPERTVAFETTYTLTSPFCGDAVIAAHEVGRIASTTFFNPDGSLTFGLHDAAITATWTNTETGATLTFFYSNFIHERDTFDPATGAITVTASFNGLNFIIEGTDGPPLVAAGRAVITLLVTFDEDGNPVVTQTIGTVTPNLAGKHLLQLLCA